MSNRSNARVLVVALDMGDRELVQYWTRQGQLPHLAALIGAGAMLELQSPAEVLHTSAWPTFATGVLPGRHGIYYPYQPTPGQQYARRIDASQCGAATFWSRADAGGRRCHVYDIPETFPELGFHGSAIFDWGTWARYGDTAAQPTSLLAELRARFGAYPLGLEAMQLGFACPDGIEEPLLRSVRYKQETARWLLQRGAWDLAVIGFGETHVAGHYFWPPGVRGIGTTGDEAFERLLAVYVAIDEAVGALRADLPPDTTTMVVSGDGVRPNHCGWHLLPAVLERLGVAGTGPSAGHASRPPSLLGRLPQLVPAGMKARIAAGLPWRVRNQLALWSMASAFDWSMTKAFALPSDLEGCIRINLTGREPQGIVERGAQYEDLCHEIRVELKDLVNPATGAPAVSRVWMRNEVFPGDQQEELPDLIVTWNDAAPIASLASRRIGVVEGLNPDRRPGTHSTSGFLIAQGPAIGAGYKGQGALADIAPTVLLQMGVADTGHTDGRPLPWARPVQSAPE